MSTTTATTPFDVSAELKSLRHERNNKNLHRLPAGAVVKKRPLNHAPIADLRRGDKVSKVVYVSQRTPLMAAVKRVKKYLEQIEGRQLQKDKRQHDVKRAADNSDSTPEQVLVKASGRAMAQALRVGEWFRSKEQEVLCRVEVRTGSVSAVDDIVEVEGEEEEEQHTETLVDGDTTLELLGNGTAGTTETASTAEHVEKTTPSTDQSAGLASLETTEKAKNTRKKRKRPVYEAGNLPEARIRWVKTVEVAISLQE